MAAPFLQPLRLWGAACTPLYFCYNIFFNRYCDTVKYK